MIIFLYAVIILICIWYFIVSFFGAWLFVGWERDALGQFGDSWGWLTSIFSAFAFAGVFHNNQMQKKVLKQAQAESKKQSEFLRAQQFESNFFQMMGLLQEIIKDIDRVGIKVRQGRDCFSLFYEEIFGGRFLSISKFQEINKKSDFDHSRLKNDLRDVFDSVYISLQSDLAHYFRFTYNILKFIDESEINKDAQRRYVRIFRAQLSNYELLMIFYNCFSTHGKKFEDLANEFCLFDNMPSELLQCWFHILLIDEGCVNENDLKKAKEQIAGLSD